MNSFNWHSHSRIALVGPNNDRQLYGVAAVDFALYELKDVMDGLKYGRR